MAKRRDKKAERVRRVFELANGESRTQWEYVNQKGFDFANDNQLTESERVSLEEQGMPTFTINRIMPVVEMLNFYATANKPRWQAVGAEGSDTDVAAVFSDLADYIWDLSDGSSLYANAINDSICKGVGYLQVDVNPDSDNGLGDLTIKQPEPFDIFIDPKSRDMLFRDASFILIRKILPKEHLKNLFPQYSAKINKANSDRNDDISYSEKNYELQKDFDYKDISGSESVNPDSAETDELLEYYELFEKIKVKFLNVFYQIPPEPEVLAQINKEVEAKIMEMQQEMQVQLLEQQQQMQIAVQEGKMLPQRFELEMKKATEMMENQLKSAEQEIRSNLIQNATTTGNKIVSEEEFKILIKDEEFADTVVEAVPFYGTRIKQTTVVGNKSLFEVVLPDSITEYPIVPFHFKWTGTPFPISAVSPLIGKQREINKAHQLLVHNASLGSSLRWMYEEGSVDTDMWEQYSSSPGALLPIRPGAAPPTPVQPAPLNSAFFQITQESKQDMEYLAGIYSSMQGDTGAQHETYRGLLALDEYGTRRIKRWMNNSLEPALKQLGTVVKQFSQSVYTAHKVFRIVQPSALQEQREVEINIPMYNDYGEAIGKYMDYSVARFDVRIVAGSTLPVNRWAYLSELKELMQMGVVDDIAVLAETDIRNKDKIAKRKSLYSQLQGQLQQMEETIKDKEGAIETLERQLVQAGIKGKVMQAEMEINKKKEETKAKMDKSYITTEAKQKTLQYGLAKNAEVQDQKVKMAVDNFINELPEEEEQS
jgi:hypothetical protein